LGLSEVDVEHYVHEWNKSGCPVEDKCRDIRYKYPISAAEAWTAARRKPAGDAARQLVAFLEACGVTNPAILSTEEFEQLVGQYVGETASQCQAALRDHDRKLDDSHLNLLWKSALRPYPVPTIVTRPVKPKPSRKDLVVPVASMSQIDTEQLLLKFSKRLKGNVGDELKKNTVALAQVIHSYPTYMQPRCITDIQELLLKESKFMNNNMKLDEQVPRLKSAWDRARDGEQEPPADSDEDVDPGPG
jgi:hypothetical protein